MGSIINILQLSLDGASARQKALSNNIANVDTPNYKRKDVDFISTLNTAVHKQQKLTLARTHGVHLDSSLKGLNSRSFKEVRIDNLKYRNDGNNVDMDHEMAEMAKNYIYYYTLTEQTNERFKMLNDTIKKGSR